VKPVGEWVVATWKKQAGCLLWVTLEDGNGFSEGFVNPDLESVGRS